MSNGLSLVVRIALVSSRRQETSHEAADLIHRDDGERGGFRRSLHATLYRPTDGNDKISSQWYQRVRGNQPWLHLTNKQTSYWQGYRLETKWQRKYRHNGGVPCGRPPKPIPTWSPSQFYPRVVTLPSRRFQSFPFSAANTPSRTGKKKPGGTESPGRRTTQGFPLPRSLECRTLS